MYQNIRTVTFLIFAKVSFLAAKENSNDEFNPRIVGGSVVQSASEIPFIVSLQYNEKHICGGSLYGMDAILTAAHCLYSDDTYKNFLDPTKLSVVAGTTKPTDSKAKGREKRQAGIFVAHPAFVAGDINSDIAIIIVTKDFPRSSTIDSITLRSISVPIGEKCYTAGWGVTKFESSKMNDDLKKAEVDSVAYSFCIEQYAANIPESLICAYQRGQDSCQGDSGGPLVCNGELSGVVSRGRECGTSFPGLYSNVSYFRSWIQETKSGTAKPIISINIFLISIIYLCIYNAFQKMVSF